MRIFTYLTEQCKNDAQRHGHLKDIERWTNQVEKNQNIFGVEWRPPFIKKNIRYRGRLIIERREIGNNLIYCLLRMYMRGSDYQEFTDILNASDAIHYQRTYSPSEEVLCEYLKQRQDLAGSPLPELKPEEQGVLHKNFKEDRTLDEMILESPTWAERMEFNEYRVSYGELLEELITPQNQNGTKCIKSNDSSIAILYRYFQSLNLWFIIAPIARTNPSKDEKRLRREYQEVLEIDDYKSIAQSIVMQQGRRLYSADISIDRDLWMEIQKNGEANLALSPEEKDILESVLDDNRAFPLFINGRPGSGKSTILQYLFAEYLRPYLKKDWALDQPPLYLTYNDSLSDEAKRVVKNILKYNSNKVLDDGTDAAYLEKPEIAKEIDRSFRPFRRFLLSCLPPNEDDRFNNRKYVDFTKFRDLYRTRFSRDPKVSKTSPEIAWHVIRSYIKGMRQDTEYLDPDCYQDDVPTKQKSISMETFKDVYEGAWKHYRRLCQDERYWDDQDLVRYLLDLEYGGQIDLGVFPAVFCDEAQDFTTVELELILRLSLFTKREVPHYHLRKIPFAFAGDPLQTLNPSGFNWDATKTSFYNNIVMQLDKTGKANLEFNYKELDLNYRSKLPIVQFCNLVLLKRGIAFDNHSLRPQEAWQAADRGSLPAYFNYNQKLCRQHMREERERVIIVPCHEGQEKNYIQEDDFLKTFAWDKSQDIVSRDVQSPMRAKGLQFKRVVLYKFGEYALHHWQSSLDVLDCFLNDPIAIHWEKLLPLQYFVNWLYVAASRAREHLIIIDTQGAKDKFWSFALKTNFQKLIHTYQSSTWKEDHLGKVVEGVEDSWNEGQKDDPVELAKHYYRLGQDNKDPYCMELARQRYDMAGKEADAAKAKSLKFEYEGEWRKAGEIYESIGTRECYQDALRCYGKLPAYSSILALGEKETYLQNSNLYRVAEFVLGCRSWDKARDFVNGIDLGELNGDIQWSDIFSQVCNVISHYANDSKTDLSQWKFQDVFRKLEIIANDGIEISELGHTKDIVRSKTEAYPENLKWLKNIKQYKEIQNCFENDLETPIEKQHRDIILDACFQDRNLDVAIRLIQKYPSEECFRQILASLQKRQIVSSFGSSAQKILRPIPAIDRKTIEKQWSQKINKKRKEWNLSKQDTDELLKYPELNYLVEKPILNSGSENNQNYPNTKLVIKISDHLVLEGQLNLHRRSLELKNVSDLEGRAVVRAIEKDVQALYLNVEEVDLAGYGSKAERAWHISQWAIICIFEPSDTKTLIRLEYEPNRKFLIALQI